MLGSYHQLHIPLVTNGNLVQSCRAIVARSGSVVGITLKFEDSNLAKAVLV